MNMKRIFAFALAVIMIVSTAALAACGNDPEQPEEEIVESARWEGSKLCLTVNGKDRYYTRSATSSEMFSPDLVLAEFTEELEWEGIIWTVYSVKEREDLSTVIAISGTNSIWICTAE